MDLVLRDVKSFKRRRGILKKWHTLWVVGKDFTDKVMFKQRPKRIGRYMVIGGRAFKQRNEQVQSS